MPEEQIPNKPTSERRRVDIKISLSAVLEDPTDSKEVLANELKAEIEDFFAGDADSISVEVTDAEEV